MTGTAQEAQGISAEPSEAPKAPKISRTSPPGKEKIMKNNQHRPRRPSEDPEKRPEIEDARKRLPGLKNNKIL